MSLISVTFVNAIVSAMALNCCCLLFTIVTDLRLSCVVVLRDATQFAWGGLIEPTQFNRVHDDQNDDQNDD